MHDLSSVISRNFYFAHGGVRSIAMSASVCPLAYLENHTCEIYQILCTLPMDMARYIVTSQKRVMGKFYGQFNNFMSLLGNRNREMSADQLMKSQRKIGI